MTRRIDLDDPQQWACRYSWTTTAPNGTTIGPFVSSLPARTYASNGCPGIGFSTASHSGRRKGNPGWYIAPSRVL